MSRLISNVNISTDLLVTDSIPTISVGNSTSNSWIVTQNSSSVNIGPLKANTTTIFFGNSVSQTFLNSTSFYANSIIVGGQTYTSVNSSADFFQNVQVFTVSGVWIKPSWATANDIVTVTLWGGGGGNTGGACSRVNILAGNLPTTCNVTVGGGTSANGENTVFFINSTFSFAAVGGTSTALTGGKANFGLGFAGGYKLHNQVWGGGQANQATIYGGAGYGNTTVFGGRAANSTASATPPGGGGSTVDGKAGARGEARIMTVSQRRGGIAS